MAIFNSKLLSYQRVNLHLPMFFLWFSYGSHGFFHWEIHSNQTRRNDFWGASMLLIFAVLLSCNKTADRAPEVMASKCWLMLHLKYIHIDISYIIYHISYIYIYIYHISYIYHIWYISYIIYIYIIYHISYIICHIDIYIYTYCNNNLLFFMVEYKKPGFFWCTPKKPVFFKKKTYFFLIPLVYITLHSYNNLLFQ